MRKETAVIAIIVAAVAGFFVGNMTAKKGEGGEQPADGEGAIGAAGDTPAAARGGAETPDLYKVPVGNSPFKGERDALVTIVEFSDFQ
jgi:protein-disulfide isomerase